MLSSTYTPNFREQDQAVPISAQVLNLPELLATILLDVQPKDLLFQQRVNKTWEGVIKRTPSLQRKLFLRADVWDMSDELPVLEWNPFLSHMGWDYDRKPPYFMRASAKILEAYNQPTASWKNMFITQPASCDLHASISSKFVRVFVRGPKVPTGWTLGMIMCKQEWGTSIAQVSNFREFPGPLYEIRFFVGDPAGLERVVVEDGP